MQLGKCQISSVKVNVNVKCHDHVRYVGHVAHVPHLGHLHVIAHAQCYNLLSLPRIGL